MNNELLAMLEFLEQERDIDKDTMFQIVEEALTSAAQKELEGTVNEPTVTIDRKSGDVVTWALMDVVEEVGDRRTEIDVEDAQDIDAEIEIGDTIRTEFKTTKSMSRIAAQATKQAIMQKLRLLERERVQDDYEDQIGELLNGTVRYFERGEVIIDFGQAEGSLGNYDRISGEDYRNGDNITVLLKEININRSGPSLICSRSHVDLVRRLFEREVSEIEQGIVEIKGIAREAGYRTKIAVSSSEARVDPVGACVGMRGSRVKAIVRELNREKLDIIHWTSDTKDLIKEALKPAEVMEVELDYDEEKAIVTVSDDQYSLAVGRRGHNAKLARQLTGWNVVITRYEFKEEQTFEDRLEEVKAMFAKVEGVSEELADSLVSNGYLSLAGLGAAEASDLTSISEISAEEAEEILEIVRKKIFS
ncbi:MAG: transcription termination/antitermination protein NusA [Lentisphaeraceae bacterium]|nr:transcription termination/antitermination protein NusA [Lentisphaeraceae bacterium]